MTSETTRLLRWAAALSLLAGFVHGLLVEEHFGEWWGYGVFFMLASMLQGMYGFAILASEVMNGSPVTTRWEPRYLRAFYVLGIVGNLALVAMYVVSRTYGVPFVGPEAGEVEPWDALGIATKLLELAVAAVLVVLLRRARAGALGEPSTATA